MKKTLILTSLALFFGATITHAATTDFTADADILVPSVIQSDVTANMTILSGSSAESWQYSSGNLTVTNPDSIHEFKITSDSGVAIHATANGTEVACVSNINPGSTYLLIPSIADTYNLYTSNNPCSATHGSSGHSSGSVSISVSKIPSIVNVESGKNCASGQMFDTATGKPCSQNVSPSVTVGIFVFTKDLKNGMKDSEIKLLQHYLNTHGFVVASSGAGSLDNETTLFGSATKSALIKFQKANNISPAIGYFGKVTRAFVNSH